MDCIDSVEYYQLKNARFIKCTAHECEFSYRNSIFKNELKNQVIITHVNFRLNKNPEFHTGYPDLKKELDNYPETTIANIRSAIITIRQKKLPDPVVTGNAGSFFKNPVIEKEQAYALTRHYPTIPLFDNPDGRIKLSAAWLIEQCGWKGKIWGNTGTYKNQPLILINRGGATGSEIYQCAQKIRKAVMNHFAIKLGMEVNVL
jgi:UDP-N-acetylmuramate dehydrogenase